MKYPYMYIYIFVVLSNIRHKQALNRKKNVKSIKRKRTINNTKHALVHSTNQSQQKTVY